MINHLPRMSNAEEIIHFSYMISAYLADPREHFAVISEKTFDIEEVNPELLNKFIDSVDFRLKYSVRFDHEIY